MSRGVPLSEIDEDIRLITKRTLAVLCASIVATDGILSAPLQLGSKLLLSRAAVLLPGLENWNLPLIDVDAYLFLIFKIM